MGPNLFQSANGFSISYLIFSSVVHGGVAIAIMMFPEFKNLSAGNSKDFAEVEFISTASHSTTVTQNKVQQLNKPESKIATAPKVEINEKPIAKTKSTKSVKSVKNQVKVKKVSTPKTLPEKSIDISNQENEGIIDTPTEQMVTPIQSSNNIESDQKIEDQGFRDIPEEENYDAKTNDNNIGDTYEAEEESALDTAKIESLNSEESNIKKVEPPVNNHSPTSLNTSSTNSLSNQNGEVVSSGVPQGTRLNTDLKQHPGNSPPIYPALARQEHLEGIVDIVYDVTDDGRVTNIKIIKSSGHRVLDQEAVRALQRYRYFPGQEGRTYHPVVFKLKGPNQALPSRLRTSSR